MKIWTDRWCYQWSLKDLFPHLYRLSTNQQGTVAEFGSWAEGVWCQNLSWIDALEQQVREAEMMLEETIMSLQPDQNIKDMCCWSGDDYKWLINKSGDEYLVDTKKKVIKSQNLFSDCLFVLTYLAKANNQ